MVLVSCCCCCFDAVKSQTSRDGSTVELSYPFIPLSMTLSVVEAAQHSTVVSVEIEDDINFISRFLSNQGQTLHGGEIITWAVFFYTCDTCFVFHQLWHIHVYIYSRNIP